jgi:phytoene synthase
VSHASRASYESIRRHSKSFSLASRLLPARARLHAVAVYAWCRRADDAVDLAPVAAHAITLRRLESELDAVYAGDSLADPVVSLFQRTVRERAIPIEYPRDLLAGMEMDLRGQSYETMEELLLYCYRVAGCVGLMMSHVMGVRNERALRHAVHMGMAMQLTNVCRDVEEDWERGRLYLPDELLQRHGAPGLARDLGRPFPDAARVPVARATADLLDEADRYYASGDHGLPALTWRCAMAIRAARLVYSSIGREIRRAHCDPRAGRAYVSTPRKLGLMLQALAVTVADLPARRRHRERETLSPPTRVVSFPRDVLPI